MKVVPKVFLQYGFLPAGESSGNVYGNCPLCGSEKHFYIDPKSKKWDCKVCGLSGGFQTFLREVVNLGKAYFCGNVAKKLSEEKGISVETLKSFDVGYNPLIDRYIIPVYSADKKTVIDIRRYEKKKLWSTSECNVGLFGLKDKKYDTVWLCEGEWDGMAISELLGDDNNTNLILAVPGAGTFKDEWCIYFDRKIVNVLYDNDSAGEKGCKKVYNRLNNIAKEIRFLHWSDTHRTGYDVRDLYMRYGKDSFKRIKRNLKTSLPGVESSKLESSTKKEELYTGERIDSNNVKEVYRKWLEFPDDDDRVIDIIYGTVIANRMQGDPLWLFLVAPSGGMKTELLLSLSEAVNIYTTTSITPKTLVSGANFGGGGDPSLIPRLDGKVLVIKDFTTILDMNAMFRDEIFAILRDAYDGKTEKEFGNGIIRSYHSKFGILAGVTPAIELYTEGNTALGERFLYFRIPIKLQDSRILLERAIGNTNSEDTMRKELLEIASKALEYNYKIIPVIPNEILQKILSLAQWTASMRGSVIRDKYTKEITHAPFMELGTRVAKQYMKLLIGIAMFRGLKKVSIIEYNLILNVARSSVPSRLGNIVRFMFFRNKESYYTTNEIVEYIRLPVATSTRLLENLTILGILNKRKVSGLVVDWKLTDIIIELIETSNVYKREDV